jgi:GDPmannose 4,6-dehydratase
MKIAIITGVTGQDGSYLAEFLLEKNYTVIGLTRRTSLPNTGRISHLFGHTGFTLEEFDITDIGSIIRVFQKLPAYERLEVYNLAAQSHVNTSFYQPECSANVDAIGPLKMLEAIRLCKLTNCRFYQAATSELYGRVQEIPQTESTPFYPRSPYGVAKMYSFWIVKNYRESYDMYACSGILFNHESERRGHEFVTRKITLAVARSLKDANSVLTLGNLDSKRDWGHARDYVKGMWLMLQQEKADDFVMATGETHTVREFIERSFRVADIDIEWKGSGVDEVGVDKKTGRTLVRVDPRLYRPAEVDLLIGNPAKARTVLGWVPEMTFETLVDTMTRYDIQTFNTN